MSASTQNQLFCALQKLWIEGLGHECLNNKVLLRAPDSHYLPFVLSKADIKMLLAATLQTGSYYSHLLMVVGFGSTRRSIYALKM